MKTAIAIPTMYCPACMGIVTVNIPDNSPSPVLFCAHCDEHLSPPGVALGPLTQLADAARAAGFVRKVA